MKYSSVRAGIVKAIRSGAYRPGERLPAERELAKMYNVSYMTARRAVSDLVEVNILERRDRSGTYVRPGSDRLLGRKTVNLICRSDDDPAADEFIHRARSAAEARGWSVNIVRWSGDLLLPAVRAIRSEAVSLVAVDADVQRNEIGKAMAEASDRVVAWGAPMDEQGVASVLCDEVEAMRLAIRELRSLGHKRIALMASATCFGVSSAAVQAWRDECGDAAGRLIEMGGDLEAAYKSVADMLADDAGVTALLTGGSHACVIALAACHDAGRAVPERMSILGLGNAALSAYTRPAISCIDRREEQTIALAMDLLGNPPAAGKKLHLLPPRLVARQSLARAPA
jgi:DNA-binding LacI/PurR family transcriptional regulator